MAVVTAGLAIVVTASTVGAARMCLSKACGQDEGDECEERFHFSSDSCFCMLLN